MSDGKTLGAAKTAKEPEPDEMLRIIFDYAAKIANERRLEQLLLLMADMGREMVVADRCTVWLVDRPRCELYSAAAHGVPLLRMPMQAGLAGHCVTMGKPIFIDDAYRNQEFKEVLEHGAIAMDRKTGYRTKSLMVIPFRNNDGEITGVYQAVNKLTDEEHFSKKDMDYLTLAASYAGKALESALLSHEIEETQKELIFTIGEIGESRSKETGNHVKRVAEYSYVLALGLGLPQKDAELLKIASPMHDIGKVAIPDEVLKKPGKLSDAEFDLMKTHAEIGYGLLNKSNREILKAAAIVARQHHEKWNGQGYPQGLKGEDIHIFGRITALADVFDALGSDRVYKKAWTLESIVALIREERGRHFDPQVVDVFFRELPKLLEIRQQYSDDML